MIDLWIIDKFNILPSDNRFLDLFEEQKIAIFEGVCSLPANQDDLRKTIRANKEIERLEKLKDEEFINKGMIKRMKLSFKKDNRNEEEVEKLTKQEIKKIAESIRKQKIKEIEEFKNG